MEAILLVVHVFIAVALIGVVLIQRSDQDGFGLGSGSGSNMLSGRQSANILTRTTAILATLFIINSLVLGILASNRDTTSLVDQLAPPTAQEATSEAGDNAPQQDPVPPSPVAPSVPLAE